MSVQQVRPSRVWYWVGAALVVGSVVWLVLNIGVGVYSLNRQIDGLQRVSIPGQGEVTFTQAGDYILYYEGRGASSGNSPAFNASLAPTGGGGAVKFGDYGGSLTYDLSGRLGRALGTFHIDKPGTFLLRTESAEASGQGNVAVGGSVSGAIVRTVVVAIVGGAVLFLAGVALLVVVAIRRRRARRMLPAPGMEAGSGGPASLV
jgi:hypothetical protein